MRDFTLRPRGGSGSSCHTDQFARVRCETTMMSTFTMCAATLPCGLLWILLAGPVWLLSRIPFHRLPSSSPARTLSIPARQDAVVKNGSQGVSLPLIVIQVGESRTATTLQFQHACVAMHLVHETVGTSEHCFYLGTGDKIKDRDLVYIRDLFHKSTSVSTEPWEVLKTHMDVSEVMEAISSLHWQWRQRVWIFTTTAHSDFAKGWRMASVPAHSDFATYIRATEDISRKGVSNLTTEYAKMFGLSPEQVDSFHQYMDMWTILRQCCGTQMSQHWMAVLQGRSRSYPPCEQHNITQVELALMSSYVYRTFGSREGLIGALSDRDHAFTGHYCEAVANYYKNHKQQKLGRDFSNRRRMQRHR